MEPVARPLMPAEPPSRVWDILPPPVSRRGILQLENRGNVEFVDDVAFTADSAIWVGSGGVIRAHGKVSLTAPYVKLGQEFLDPVPEDDQVSPFLLVNINAGQAYNFAPAGGSGQFNVNAQLIDVGTTVLDGISKASLTAANGDVRGNGIFAMSGDLTITAGQVYPSTAASFDIFVYDNGVRRDRSILCSPASALFRWKVEAACGSWRRRLIKTAPFALHWEASASAGTV